MERFWTMVIKVPLRHLNDCRMHLHALRLSDICTAADGRYPTNNAMEVQLTPIAVPVLLATYWRPSFANRSLWRSAIC
jgi:hypothetical protein